MAHAQAETQFHLNLLVGWDENISVEKEVFEPYFEGRVGFKQTLQQMAQKEET